MPERHDGRSSLTAIQLPARHQPNPSLQSPGGTFERNADPLNDEDTPTYGDTILFRRYPGAHQESGRVIGRCKDRHGWRFDIETPDGNRFDNLTDVVLDQGEAEKLRRAELAAITGDAA